MNPPPLPDRSLAASLLLLATKGTVVAMERATGRRVWQTTLASGWNSGDYVSLIADETRVFAHTKGVIHCLDLATGAKLWEDGLAGLGYNLSSLAFPGGAGPTGTDEAEELRRRARTAADNSRTQP